MCMIFQEMGYKADKNPGPEGSWPLITPQRDLLKRQRASSLRGVGPAGRRQKAISQKTCHTTGNFLFLGPACGPDEAVDPSSVRGVGILYPA